MTTREHIASAKWWPTSAVADQAAYVGAETCAKCHEEIVQTQSKSQMARTLGPAGRSAVLSQHLQQQYRSGPYTYTLSQHAGRATMQISAGQQSRSADLRWAFGSGEVGQSYLWQEADGSFREARFNYFSSLNGFGATPGRLHGAPVSLDMAMGRRVEDFEAKTCFACHTTSMSSATPVDVKSLVPGIHCEACHGPGAQHVAAMQATDAKSTEDLDTHIVNSAHMTPAQSVDFCGACHSTPWDVRIMGATGVQTVRFPAYRLEKSRCWGTQGDTRVTCYACHNPHAPLERRPAAYDGACLQCHRLEHQQTDAQHPGAACPVAKSNCVTCHMQKYELPEMHAKFTDHMIRVVRSGAAIPD
jgi:hypothetical protein